MTTVDRMPEELMDRIFGERTTPKPVVIEGQSDVLEIAAISRMLNPDYVHYGDHRSVKKVKLSPADIARKKKQSAQKKARKISRNSK